MLTRNMAIAEPIKKGGRYTKKQQKRRLHVHNLHFDENKSAVEIAEILNVNRNTVNEDIKFWVIDHMKISVYKDELFRN